MAEQAEAVLPFLLRFRVARLRAAIVPPLPLLAVLRIAFLPSAVLQFCASLGVAIVAVHGGFHLLGTLGFGAWDGRMGFGSALFVLLLAPASPGGSNLWPPWGSHPREGKQRDSCRFKKA